MHAKFLFLRKALDVELEVVKGERDRLMTERSQMKVELQSVSDKLVTEELVILPRAHVHVLIHIVHA